MIENTSRSMQNPDKRAEFLSGALLTGGSDLPIIAQEAAGQAQLVNSDRLPTDLRDDRAEYEALGFVFGEPDPGDLLFVRATLPEGWTRKGSDHDMWSHLYDELGRRRASIFYKAAFYDRHAHVTLASVSSYIYAHMHDGVPLVTDESWATPAAITETCTRGIERSLREMDRLTPYGEEDRIASHQADVDRYRSIRAEHGSS